MECPHCYKSELDDYSDLDIMNDVAYKKINMCLVWILGAEKLKIQKLY